jgi:DNA-binding MarR family transcriptional regulator
LRRPLSQLRRRIHAALVAQGFEDIHPAHLNVFQYPGPRGVRPSELAHNADMTKQAMNHLLGQLTELGYVERRALTGPERGTAVWLTARGERAVKLMRETVLALEAEWEALLGARRFVELRTALVELNERLSTGEGRSASARVARGRGAGG